MDIRDEVVCIRREDGVGAEGIAILLPRFPETGVGVRLPVWTLDAVRLFAFSLSCSLVKAASEEKASPLFERVSEHRLLGDGLRSGVDRPRDVVGIVSPVRKEGPLEVAHHLGLVVRDGDEGVPWGDIVPLSDGDALRWCRVEPVAQSPDLRGE